MTRLVQIVALDVKRTDGLVLVWLGHRKANGDIIDKCVLPGHKFAEGDSPKDAVAKLLSNELRPLANGIKLKPGYKVSTKTMFSSRYQCNTQYYTALFEATMDRAFDWPAVMRPLPVDAIDLRPHKSGGQQHESFCRRFCVETHTRPDMFELVYGDRNKQWPPITCDWPPSMTEIYAWVPPWELKWLTTSEFGAVALRTWLSQLKLTRHGKIYAPQETESPMAKPRRSTVGKKGRASLRQSISSPNLGTRGSVSGYFF